MDENRKNNSKLHTSWIEVEKSNQPIKLVKRWESYFEKSSFQFPTQSVMPFFKNAASEKQKSRLPQMKFL
jgi:hypothetical protein